MTNRDRLIELLEDTAHEKGGMPSFGDIADYLLANDFTKVVRCKDCKHCEHINDEFDKDWWQCKRRGNSFQRKPNDFCSYGELKECEGK